MKSLKVEEDILHDLKLLKGVLHMDNMTALIRSLMKSAGFNAAWFQRMKRMGVDKQ